MSLDMYSESATIDRSQARRDEREAFDIVITAMREVTTPVERENALQKAEALWMYLLDDLSNDENRLAVDLRAKIISIGLWALKEVTSLRLDRRRKANAFIEVCEIIRDGLE